MKTIQTFLIVLSAAIVPAAVASANHQTSLDAAACRYHDAVKEFECKVNDVGFVDRYDLRLVHRLVDAACDLHTAARYPDAVDQVLCRWDQVRILHRRVAAAIFARSCYPQHPVLTRCWEEVSCAANELAKAIDCACNRRRAFGPRVGGSRGTTFGVPNPVLPHAGIPNTVLPNAAILHAAIPHAAISGAPLPRTNVPPVAIPHRNAPNTLPQTFAPADPRLDRQVRPEVAPPQPVNPLTDEIRYFGPRQFNQPSSRHNVGAHFTGGNDYRSALIGALLSRLMQ